MKKFYAKGKVYRRWAKIYHSPVEGKGACELWRFANTVFDIPKANQLMRDCGYIPFCGYPLKRLL